MDTSLKTYKLRSIFFIFIIISAIGLFNNLSLQGQVKKEDQKDLTIKSFAEKTLNAPYLMNVEIYYCNWHKSFMISLTEQSLKYHSDCTLKNKEAQLYKIGNRLKYGKLYPSDKEASDLRFGFIAHEGRDEVFSFYLGMNRVMMINGSPYEADPYLISFLIEYLPVSVQEEIRIHLLGSWASKPSREDIQNSLTTKEIKEEITYDQAIELAKQNLRDAGYYKDDQTVYMYDPKASFWYERYAGSPELLKEASELYGLTNKNYYAIHFCGKSVYIRDGGATAFVDKDAKRVIGVLYDGGRFVENIAKKK